MPFLWALLCLTASAQTIPTDQPNVIPPSPDAQAFQRYGEYPVDNSTGVPKIDIPLYQIHSGKLSLPVSISYHASGIKINDIASVVGLGWSLKAGGMVSRSIKGLPDELASNGYLNQLHKTQADIDNSTADANLFSYLNAIALQTNDGESDNYFYSAGDNLSGQFVYDSNNNITPTSYTESKITRNLSNNTFDIIGDDGTDYQFTQIETEQSSGIANPFTASWYLTRMVSYDKVDTIQFEYNSINTGDADCYLAFSKYQLTSGTWSGVTQNTSSVTYLNEVLLTKIDFKNGYLQFDYQNGRLDRRQYQLNAVSLNSINPDQSVNLLKRYTFTYSYFNSGANDSYNNRLRLDKVNVLDKNLQRVNGYSFFYNNTSRLPAYYNPTVQNPDPGWMSMDYWGYYNGSNNNHLIPGLPAVGAPNYSGTPPADRTANENYAQADILQQITFPTGGTTSFAYEGNRDVNNNLIGGLRVKTVTSTAGSGSQPIVKRYVYNASTVLNIAGYPFNYQYFQKHTNGQVRDDRTIYFGSYPWPMATHSGSSIIYTSVTETTDGAGSPSLKTDYGYQLDIDREYHTNCERLNEIYFADRSWARGQLINTLYYIYRNGTYQKLKEVDNLYTILKSGTLNTGLVVFKSFINSSSDNWVWSDTKTIFYYFDAQQDYGIRKLQQQNTIEYDNNQSPTLVTSNQYQYNSTAHLYPTQQTTTDSKGVAITKTTQYVPDVTQTGVAETARQQLLTANNISPVLKQQVQKGVATTTESLSYKTWNGHPYPNIMSEQFGSGPSINRYTYVNYDNWGDEVQTQKLNEPFDSYLWGYNKAYPIAQIKNAQINDVFFDNFEEGDGNSSNGDARTGRYSYNGTFTSFSKSLSGLDAGTYTLTYWLKTGSAWTWQSQQVSVSGSVYTITISGQIDDVRFYPASAQMTSYTYDSMIGVTSMTDTKGEVTFYEYDGSQRLMNVRDKDKNIIKSYCYNYAGEVSNCYVNQPSFTNDEKDSVVYKNCGSGYTSSAVTYVVPQGTYTSNISKQDANNQAKNDAIAGSQIYANVHGSCTVNTAFALTNNTGSGYQINFTGPFNVTYNFLNNGTTTIQVPIGTYSVSIYPTGTYVNHTISLTGQTNVVAPRANFSNVVVSTSTSLTALIY